jgi:hypothetical protein
MQRGEESDCLVRLGHHRARLEERELGALEEADPQQHLV